MSDAKLIEFVEFIAEKLDEAFDNEQNRKTAIGEAMSAMPDTRKEIARDETERTWALAAMVCEPLITKAWEEWWDQLANDDRLAFLEKAYRLRVGICGFRGAVATK